MSAPTAAAVSPPGPRPHPRPYPRSRPTLRPRLRPERALVPHDAYAAVFFRECFIDELARAAWRDPVQYRREMLPAGSRLRKVLDEAASAAGWSRPLPAGMARGVALSAANGAAAAHVAELRLGEDGRWRLQRVVVAVDGEAGAAEGLARQGVAPAVANAMALVRARGQEALS